MEKILLVEDSKSFSAALSGLIHTRWQLDVVSAYSLEDTRRALSDHGQECVLAIIDLNLPDAPDGEAVDLVLEQRIPGIVFTAKLNNELREAILQKGVADYVLKQGAYNIEYVVNIVGRLLKNRSISALVVSADEDKRNQMGRWLRLQNLNVLDAAGGRDAMTLLEREPRIQTVIVDYGVKDIASFSLISQIREQWAAEELAIMGVSDVEDRHVGSHFIKSGATDVLVYPFPPEELNCRVNHSLEMIEQFHTLKELNLQKNQLMGMAAHDIRGPIGNISAACKMLQSEKIKQDRRDTLFEMIRHASEDVLKLLNDLLDVSAIESGQMKLQLMQMNLTRLIEERVRFYQMSAEQKDITIEMKLDDSVFFEGDSGRLSQLMDNLISNAIKYSGRDSRIRVTLQEFERYLEVGVEDEGVGIPEEEGHRLFEAFSNISSMPTGGESSTGLGLAICKNIVKLHKGEIGIKTPRDKGTHFYFCLPVSTH